MSKRASTKKIVKNDNLYEAIEKVSARRFLDYLNKIDKTRKNKTHSIFSKRILPCIIIIIFVAMVDAAATLGPPDQYVTGSRTVLNALLRRGDAVPDEVQRVQELVECVDNNAQKIAAALVANRRGRGVRTTGVDTTAQLLKEQKQFISQVSELRLWLFYCSELDLKDVRRASGRCIET